MSRIRKVLILVGVLTLVPAGAALAASLSHRSGHAKVTGGSGQLTVSSSTAQLLSSNGIATKAVTPASQSGETFTLPVKHGRLNAKTGHGTVHLAGGIALSNGSSTVHLRGLTIVSDKRGVSLRALTVNRWHRCRLAGHRHRHAVCHSHLGAGIVRIATVSNPTISASGISGTLNITQRTADLVNRLAGKTIIQAGAVLGTVSTSLTFA
jgi:hypothetical protein